MRDGSGEAEGCFRRRSISYTRQKAPVFFFRVSRSEVFLKHTLHNRDNQRGGAVYTPAMD